MASNSYKENARKSVTDYLETVAALDEHALLIHIHRSDGQFADPYFDSKIVIVLSLLHGLTCLFDWYSKDRVIPNAHILLNTFRWILKSELPHIGVSMGTRDICDSCFIFCESLCTDPTKRRAVKAEEWFSPLKSARQWPHVYRDSQRAALLINLHHTLFC